ncbi:GNAT family N-acetyltransferase [Rhodococcus sp. LW-XY12]|uniref:GNAT family N-acetyltransferase n=1 Tax=Rhodococcus sp. LW-XY12 TaxID=2856851 RepID=UPI001C599703|nr:GNAT family N-acetyltransferase [Rhodococcus sp. LW-XY12]QXU56754.1 GNAT family N-acetyltransferase [Rhodococcus sp. LW-XY12]
MKPVKIQLRELPSDTEHPDRKMAAHWWDNLGEEERYRLMGTTLIFSAAFQDLKAHTKLLAPGQYGWTAYDEEADLVGYIIGVVKEGVPKEMGFDYQVDPSRQGIGIGPAILREMLRDSQFAQFETFCCTVFPWNAKSVRVMEKVGFVRQEGSDRYYTYTRQPS